MEPSFSLIQYIGSIGGIGGVFGMVMFLVYRQTSKQNREDRKFAEDRLTKILDDYNETTTNNTKVLAELYTYLKARNGGK
ncbi:hypothetical protein LCGC14_1747650 [marine sediment metagenome]|uniref:Uncharacterized protein n=1 Tax=marine sediment metagenome TaxID=412755 RepID=A0A0F9H4S7_9ZZZZ